MNGAVKEKPVYQTAWQLYKAQVGKSLPTLFNFAMICIAVFAVAVLLPESLFLTFPFVVVPFFFAFAMSDSYLHHGTEITGGQFYRYYATYFQPTFFGSYRLIRNFLIAFLLGIAGLLVTAFVYYGIAYGVDPDFKTAIDGFMSSFASGQTLDLTTLIDGSVSLQNWFFATEIAEYATMSISFVFLTARAGVLPYLRSILPGGNSRMVNAIYAGAYRSIHKSYDRDFFAALWPGLLLLIGGYVGGVFATSPLVDVLGLASGSGIDALDSLSLKTGYLWVGGLLGSFIALIFFIPYYFQVMGLLVDKYRHAFAAFSMSLASQALNELKEAQRMASEQQDEVERALNEAKKNIDEDNEKKDDDDDKGEDDNDKKNPPHDSNGGNNHPNLDDYGTSDHHD